MPRDKQKECWQQWCAGKCFTAGSLGEMKALICSVCQFPWCKYSHTANFKLPTWYCCTQTWEEMCKTDTHYPAWAASNRPLTGSRLPGHTKGQVGSGSWPILRNQMARLMGLEREISGAVGWGLGLLHSDAATKYYMVSTLCNSTQEALYLIHLDPILKLDIPISPT